MNCTNIESEYYIMYYAKTELTKQLDIEFDKIHDELVNSDITDIHILMSTLLVRYYKKMCQYYNTCDDFDYFEKKEILAFYHDVIDEMLDCCSNYIQ